MPNFSDAVRRFPCRLPLLGSAALCSAMFLSACGQTQNETGNDKPVVLTTFTILQDIAEQVGGDRVEVRSITPPGAEIHEYDPTPSDIRDASEADLVIQNGMGLEDWFDQFIQHADAPSVTVTDDVDPLPVTLLSGHPDAEEDGDMPPNPHAWMSPTHGQQYVAAIEAALSELSPEHAGYFEANAQDYTEQLEQLHLEAVEMFDDLGDTGHLVTCEGAFSYLTQEYDLGEHYLWPLNAENEGTASQAQAQIRYVEEHNVPTVFCESTVNDSAQQQVVAATDATLGEPLYVDSLTDDDGPVPTYLELLEYDLRIIAEGLAQDAES